MLVTILVVLLVLALLGGIALHPLWLLAAALLVILVVNGVRA